jgi:hypothetical protein
MRSQTAARRQPPSTQNILRSTGLARSPASAAGANPHQNRWLVSSDHGSKTPNSATCLRLLRSITDTRTLTDGTGTNTKIDPVPAPAP